MRPSKSVQSWHPRIEACFSATRTFPVHQMLLRVTEKRLNHSCDAVRMTLSEVHDAAPIAIPVREPDGIFKRFDTAVRP
jgi:hypothetical protein